MSRGHHFSNQLVPQPIHSPEPALITTDLLRGGHQGQEWVGAA